MNTAVIKDVLSGQQTIEAKLQERYQAILANSDVLSKLKGNGRSMVEEILKKLLNDAQKQAAMVKTYLEKYGPD